MKFLLHTDFGHDPDDAIALSYLLEHGFIPHTINVVPGFWEQEQILTGFIDRYIHYLFNPINYCKPISSKIISKEKEDKYNSGKHKVFINGNKRIFFPFLGESETSYFDEFDKALVIGPPKDLGSRLKCKELFFQGGYSPNSINPLEKFKGELAVQSFNPGGAKTDFNLLVDSKDIETKYFIGRNVCHGFLKSHLNWIPNNPVVKLFFDKLEETKAMHDVLASMLFIDKNIGIWEQSKPQWVGNKLTTVPTDKNIFTLIRLK